MRRIRKPRAGVVVTVMTALFVAQFSAYDLAAQRDSKAFGRYNAPPIPQTLFDFKMLLRT